ncbi:MAG: hypothetical protein MSH15_01720 [Oscillospiraceae bacterium]|nr:hypothetical protein [Oscillospiraceae bacterium]
MAWISGEPIDQQCRRAKKFQKLLTTTLTISDYDNKNKGWETCGITDENIVNHLDVKRDQELIN